jgi:uncharacterized HhH-GPD family protein
MTSLDSRSDRPTLANRFVTAALKEFGNRLAMDMASRAGGAATHGDMELADPFAFLVAVILDQGIPAERAWAAPKILRARLGHFDPVRISRETDAVTTAFYVRPMPHRFPSKAASWVAAAARRVVADYGGDASALWADEPSAASLRRRFEDFDGIGQKKAAMAVEILASDFAVPVRELSGSDVAYDVHVRRVFLRAGLVPRDTVEAVVTAARLLNPARPGALDVPAWTIGRTWCRPRIPRCGGCPIAWACPTAPLPPSGTARATTSG